MPGGQPQVKQARRCSLGSAGYIATGVRRVRIWPVVRGPGGKTGFAGPAETTAWDGAAGTQSPLAVALAALNFFSTGKKNSLIPQNSKSATQEQYHLNFRR